MTNTEKLRNLMKEYGIRKCYYSHGMNLDTERPNGDIFLIGWKNNKLAVEVYKIFTEDGIVDDGQSLLVRVFPENSDAFNVMITSNMEVLDANI